MSYRIKNCSAFNDMPNMYDEIYGYCDNEHDIDLNKCMCENITDCVLKQIVEVCRKAPILDADWILNKLNIQEVE